MNILLFHQYFLGKNDPGGSRWNQFSNYFSKESNQKLIVIAGNIHYSTNKRITKNIFFEKQLVNENLTIFRTWTYSGYNKSYLGRIIGYLSYTFSSLIRAIFIQNIDIIICTSPPLLIGVSALIISKIKNIPLVFEVRDLWPESAVSTGVLSNKTIISFLYFLEKKLYKNAKKIVVLTPAFRENIIERFPEHIHKIEIITNGADFNLMKPGKMNNWVRKTYGWNDKFVFSYFGAHGVANDLIQIIKVATIFKNNDKLLFALIGDGMQKTWLKQKVKEYKLKNIHFIDSVSKDKVADFINASNVCLAILKNVDTFKTVYPNKVFDYMACKKPILITIDGITRDLIESCQCGYYSKPGNTKEFKKTIDKILSTDSKILEKLGQNGYDFAVKNFSRQELSKKYLNILKSQ